MSHTKDISLPPPSYSFLGVFKKQPTAPSPTHPVVFTAQAVRAKLECEYKGYRVEAVDSDEFNVFDTDRDIALTVVCKIDSDGYGSLEFYSQGVEFQYACDDGDFSALDEYIKDNAMPWMHHPYIVSESEDGGQYMYFINKIFLEADDQPCIPLAMSLLWHTLDDINILRAAIHDYKEA